MAKTTSAIFKFKGTIDELTFVDSKRYKPHVRARKNSKTPFVMPEALAKSKDRLQVCNEYARPIFQFLRKEANDGSLWSRIVSLLFKELKADRPLGVQCLQNLECNLQHPLSEVLAGGYEISATREHSELRIRVQLHRHPEVKDQIPRVGYQLRFVAIVPDTGMETAYKREVVSALTAYDTDLEAIELTVSLPLAEAPCMLLMGIVPHLRNEGPTRIMSDSGMKVVWVG